MGISICIPTYNRLPSLKHLLKSIFDGFQGYPYEVVIADGGSTDGTIEYLKGLDKVKLIEIGKLTGAVKAANACFNKAKYEYIFWSNDDFIIKPEILIKCCNIMDEYSDIALASPKIEDEEYSLFPSVGYSQRYLLLSKAHIFRTSVLRDIGYIDETFRTYFVDGDSTLSILKLGYSIIFTRDVGVIHTRVHDELHKKNRESINDPREVKYYKQKWEKLNSELDEYMNHYPLRKFKSILFFFIRKRMFDSRIVQYLMKRQKPFITNIYDWVLQQGIVFKNKEYDHLKDFYLTQKIPDIILKHLKIDHSFYPS